MYYRGYLEDHGRSWDLVSKVRFKSTLIGVISANEYNCLDLYCALSNQGEKSINFYFIKVPVRKKY